MRLAARTPETTRPAGWRMLAVGLLAAFALVFQAGAASAHSHAIETGLAASQAGDVTALPGGDTRDPAAPVESGAQCPLCHSPLGHGGLIVPAETVFAAAVRYASDTALPPALGPPGIAPGASPPARAPPASI